MFPIWDGVMTSAVEAIRSLLVEDIRPHLPSIRILEMLVPMFLQVLLLYPSQTPSLRFWRVALLPLTAYFSYRVLLYDFVPVDYFRPYNFIKNLAFPIGVSRATEYAVLSDRFYWIGHSNAVKGINIEEPQRRPEELRLFSFGAVKFATLQLMSHRGQGWNWGIKGALIPESRPSRGYIRSGVLGVLKAHILLIASMSTIQYSLNHDATDFLRGLGLPEFPCSRTLSGTALALTFGTSVWNFLELGFTAISLCICILTAAVRLLPLPETIRPAPFDPRSWPPLLRSPLSATSLADFWTYRWHSVLRRMFVFMGYKPMRALTAWMGKVPSTAAGVLGSFFVSGVLHESALYLGTSDIPLDPRLPSLCFFLCQGIGLVLEQVFTRMTGKPVRGWYGRAWLLLSLVIPGADVSRAWLGRGLLDHQPTPDTWEWWRWCLPMISYVPRIRA